MLLRNQRRYDSGSSLRLRRGQGGTFKGLEQLKPVSYTHLDVYKRQEEDTLYQAQVNKVDYILKKLYLKEGMNILDIGCGWGFLLLEAAKKYKVKGLGITLSKEQHREFEKRIKEEGLEDYLQVELMDYRDLPKSGKSFDRVVSVGMLEHVGRENYHLFADCASQVLKDGGLFLLHFISGLKEYSGDPWIKKYIFPGGMIPVSYTHLLCGAARILKMQ